MLQRKKLRIVASILVLFLLKTEGAEEYDDEDKPYEFGFNVEVEGKKQQHRHEEKNEEGIIKGEFGFITADDVYHVTVYAIDKEGDYKILSTKNINIKNLKPTRTSGSTPARQGHFLQLTTPTASALTVSAGATRSTTTSTDTESAVTDIPAKSTVPNASTSLLTTIVAGAHPTNTTPTEATKKSDAPILPMAFTPLATLFPDTTIVTPTVASAAMSTPVTLIAPLASTGPVIEATVTTPSTLTKPATNITHNTVDLPATYPKPAKTPTLVTSTMAAVKSANPTTKNSLSTPSTVIEPTVRIGPITSTTPAVSTIYDEPPMPNISTAPITLNSILSSDGPTLTEVPGLAMSIGSTAPITDINETITATSFKPYSLEPPEKSCAGCSIPTTTPVTPLIGLRSNFAPDDTDSSSMSNLPGEFPNITQNTTTTLKPKVEQLKDSQVSDGPTTLLYPTQSTQNVADLNTLVIPKTLSNYDHPGLPALVEQIHRQDPIRNSSSLVPKKAQTKSESAHTQRSKTREELQLDSMQSTKSPIPSKPQDTIRQNSNSQTPKLSSTNPRLRPSNVPQNSKDTRTSRGPQRLSSQDDKQTSNNLSSVPSTNAPDIPQPNVQQKSNNPASTRNSKTLGAPQQNSNRSTPVPTNSQGLPTKGVEQNTTTPSPTHGTQDSNDMPPNQSSNMLTKPQRKPIQNSNDSSSVQSNSPDLPSQIVEQNLDNPSSTESSTKTSSTTSLPQKNVQNNAKDPTQSSNTTNELELNSMQNSNGSSVVKPRQNITQKLNKPSSNQSSNSPSLPREKMQQNSKDPSATNILDKPKENSTETAKDSSLVQSKSQSLPRQDIKQNINDASPTQSSDTSSSPQHNGIQNSNPIQNANGAPLGQSNSANLPSQGIKQNSDYSSSTESSNAPSSPQQNTKDPFNKTNEPQLESMQNSNDSSVVKSSQNMTQNLNKPSSNQSSNSPSLPREKTQQNSKDLSVTNILDKPKENSTQTANDSSPVHSKSQSLPRQDIKQNINDASPTQSSDTSSSPQHNGIQNLNPIQNANGAPLVQSNSPNLPSQGIKQNLDYPSSTGSSNAPSSPQQNTKDPFNKTNELQIESMQNSNDSSVVKSSQNMTQNSNRSSPKQSSNSPSLPQEKMQQNSKDPSATNILNKLKENSMQNVNNSSPVQQDVKENLDVTSPTQSSDTLSSPQQNVTQNSNGTSLTEKSKMLGKPQQSSIQNSSDSPSVQNNSSELPNRGIKQNSDNPSLTKSSTAPSSPQNELQPNSKNPSATGSLKTLDKPKQNLIQNSTGSNPVQGDSQSLTPKDNKQNSNNLSPIQTSHASIPPQQNVQGNLKDLSPTQSSNKIDVTPQNSSDSSVIDSNLQDLLSKNDAQNSNTPSPTQSSNSLRGSQRYAMQNNPSLTPSSGASSGPRKDLNVPSSDPNSLQKSNSTSPTMSTYPRRGSVRYVPQNISNPAPQKSSTSPHVSQQRIPKQDRGPMKYSGPKPQLVSVDLNVVDKNTDIHSLSPGEKQGLPDGLNSGDMSKILYTFNYTVGFHGHFEQGYTNGTKKGYYYVTGRNGIRTRIDYTADNTGFHPKVSQEVLDLLSDDVPKPETEKDAKFGLKNNEFKWLYFPDEPKKRKRNSL